MQGTIGKIARLTCIGGRQSKGAKNEIRVGFLSRGSCFGGINNRRILRGEDSSDRYWRKSGSHRLFKAGVAEFFSDMPSQYRSSCPSPHHYRRPPITALNALVEAQELEQRRQVAEFLA
jgi:hypothetical protein